MPDKAKKPPRIVDVVAPMYQPSKAELEEDMRVRATFEEAVEALTRPMEIRYIPRPKRRRPCVRTCWPTSRVGTWATYYPEMPTMSRDVVAFPTETILDRVGHVDRSSV